MIVIPVYTVSRSVCCCWNWADRVGIDRRHSDIRGDGGWALSVCPSRHFQMIHGLPRRFPRRLQVDSVTVIQGCSHVFIPSAQLCILNIMNLRPLMMHVWRLQSCTSLPVLLRASLMVLPPPIMLHSCLLWENVLFLVSFHVMFHPASYLERLHLFLDKTFQLSSWRDRYTCHLLIVMWQQQITE